MNKIFIGMLLITLSFGLHINNLPIALISNVIGHIFMFKGLQGIKEFSNHFSKTMIFVKVMIVYRISNHILPLFGIDFSMPNYESLSF